MNRRKFTLAGLTLTPVIATASGLASAATARRKKAGKRRKPKPRPGKKVVTRTFENPRWISVPGTGTKGPAFPYPSPIDVQGLNRGRILDVNLTLKGVAHLFPADIDIMLVAPNGKAAIVMSETGDDFSVTGLTITLDDQAPTPLPELTRLTSGTYRPRNYDGSEPDKFPAPAPQGVTATSLDTFTGLNPNGQWKLYVVDDEEIDSGMITGGWSLTITARVTTRRRPRPRK